MTPFEFVFFAFQALIALVILYFMYGIFSKIGRMFVKTTKKNRRVIFTK